AQQAQATAHAQELVAAGVSNGAGNGLGADGDGGEVARQAHSQVTVNTAAVAAKCSERSTDQAEGQLVSKPLGDFLPQQLAAPSAQARPAGGQGAAGGRLPDDAGKPREPDPAAASPEAQLREALEQAWPSEFARASPTDAEAERAGLAERLGTMATSNGTVAGADVSAPTVAPRRAPAAEGRVAAAHVDLGPAGHGELDPFDRVQLDGGASETAPSGPNRRPGAEGYILSVGARPGRRPGAAMPGNADFLDSEREMRDELGLLDRAKEPLSKRMQQRSGAEGFIPIGMRRKCAARWGQDRAKAPLAKRMITLRGVVAGASGSAPAATPCEASAAVARGTAALIGPGSTADGELDPFDCIDLDCGESGAAPFDRAAAEVRHRLGTAKPGDEPGARDRATEPLAKQIQQRSGAEGLAPSARVRPGHRPGAAKLGTADPLGQERWGALDRVKVPPVKRMVTSNGVAAGAGGSAPAVAPCGSSAARARVAAAPIGLGFTVHRELDPFDRAGLECDESGAVPFEPRQRSGAEGFHAVGGRSAWVPGMVKPGNDASLDHECGTRAELTVTDRNAAQLVKQRPIAIAGVIIEMAAELIVHIRRVGQVPAEDGQQARPQIPDASRSTATLPIDSD
ncbi:unnamed protein product, partial [Prorocentrum cordatum]